MTGNGDVAPAQLMKKHTALSGQNRPCGWDLESGRQQGRKNGVWTNDAGDQEAASNC